MVLADFGNSSSRCRECTSCNHCSSHDVSMSCDDCVTWNEGRADDVREVANILYRLLQAPKCCDDINTLETEEISRKVSKL